LSAVVLLGAMGLTPPVAISEMYHYIDKNGTVSLTNVPTDRRYKAVSFDTYRLPVKVSQQELDQAIAWYSKQHRLSPALLRAVIKAESDFDPRAVSRTGALGLMQLMPRTAAAMKVEDPFNPVENIAGGAKYLRYLLNRFHGDLPLALAAYNAGEYRVKRWQQIPPIQETQFYVKKVLNYYSVFKKGGRIS
jgi:soluble lytic murein transglycosylase